MSSVAAPVPSEAPAQSPTPVLDPTSWPLIAAALGRTPQYCAAVQDRVDNHVPGQPWDQRVEIAFTKDLGQFNQQLNSLRDWYAAARGLNRDDTYLAGIRSVGEAFKQGQPITAEHQAQQQSDHTELSYKNLSSNVDKDDPDFLKKLATEAVSHGLNQRQTMQVLLLSPQVQDISKTEGEQASLRVSRQAMLHGLKNKSKVSTVQIPSQKQRSLHR